MDSSEFYPCSIHGESTLNVKTMSQMYQVDGKWMTIDQIHAMRNQKSLEIPAEQDAENVVSDTPAVSDVLSVDGKLPEKSEVGFSESELMECTVMDLRELAKKNGIVIKGQPSKTTLINLLMKK